MVCSGGASSWQDLALLLVAKYGGTEEAIRMSKIFLYQWHRDGQLPYASMIQNVDHGDAVIVRCQTWIAQNYERPDIVAELVGQSGLPKRTFDRRFRAATGYSPLAYIQALRVEEAKQPSKRVLCRLTRSGARSDTKMQPRFAACSAGWPGMPPGDYRRKFRMPGFADSNNKAAPSAPTTKITNRATPARTSRAARNGPGRRGSVPARSALLAKQMPK